ncbi:NADH-quinone oxidoreductase subunit NuoE [Alkalibacter saccharofermentans]|uniref:NAD(P)-dependent iron-only hydrogenase diaphorase component iron-sulfur protein n=1 Tax=Alkalibacter saccharofermentans DSM 14828 TaxID=1120975 RepID=A0A1M4SLX1_9FIRM|nr:NADH-quinone oxidoreductase subunit NuoE [Alkalibacter saccharofermentans]SHE33185.1 NAD(P)-dependent iron-only hydrogenase diaphorase component iron-sulfur protein [Alkalibacter saccharofermentans DSM 14828]
METSMLTKEQYDELEQFIEAIPDKKDALISVLHKAQQIFGYLPREVQFFISQKLNVPSSKVYGVITFYSYFTIEPRGKYQINVCTGTACFVRGAEKIVTEFERKLGIKVGETSEDGKFSIAGLRCVGACGLAPVVIVNEKVYGRIKPEDVNKILIEYSEEV